MVLQEILISGRSSLNYEYNSLRTSEKKSLIPHGFAV